MINNYHYGKYDDNDDDDPDDDDPDDDDPDDDDPDDDDPDDDDTNDDNNKAWWFVLTLYSAVRDVVLWDFYDILWIGKMIFC